MIKSAFILLSTYYYIPINDTTFELSFFWPSDTESRERSGSVVGYLTQDREASGSSLIGVTALWSFSKTHLS